MAGRIAVLGGDGLWSLAEVLRQAGVAVLDLEPAPKQVAPQVARAWRYGRASVRAGLLGHPRALCQLIAGDPPGWELAGDGGFVDGLRPVDPEPLALEDLRALRLAHRAAVGRALAEAERLILPLCTDRAILREGVVLDPPGGGAAEVLALDAMQADLARLATLLPKGPLVQLALLPSLAAVGAGPKLLSLDLTGFHHDPVFDALAEACARGQGGAALLAHLALGGSLDAFALPPPPEASQPRREKRRVKKAEAGRLICEDELLEAFAK